MTTEVKLVNPVAHQFGAFIVGNATHCERVVQRDSAAGQHIVICGAGPSLAEEADKHCRDGFDQLWGCNSALIWLLEQGYEPTHGFTIDQTPHMVEEWWSAPDVEYLVASTIHPHLTEWLLDKGRSLTFFHNFVGLAGPPVPFGNCEACELLYAPGSEEGPCSQCDGELTQHAMTYEDWMYSSLFEATARCGSGLNSVSRAIDLAVYMGAERVTVLGADCALRIKRPPPDATQGSDEHMEWLRECVMHADGGDPLRSGATAVTMGAELDTPRALWLGKLIHRASRIPVLRHLTRIPWLYRTQYWETKPDMAITAVFLKQMADHYGSRLRLVGDTLPNALVGKSAKYLERLPNIVDGRGNAVAFTPLTDQISGAALT